MNDQYALAKLYIFADKVGPKPPPCQQRLGMDASDFVSLEKTGWLRIGAKLNPVDSSVNWSATELQVLAGPTSQECLQTKHQQLSLPKPNIVPR